MALGPALYEMLIGDSRENTTLQSLYSPHLPHESSLEASYQHSLSMSIRSRHSTLAPRGFTLPFHPSRGRRARDDHPADI
jgi:hypothetical protein